MKIEVYDDLAAVQTIWLALQAKTAFTSPFLTYDWAETWCACMLQPKMDEKPFRLIVVSEDGQNSPVALVPFYVAPPEFNGATTRLRQIGDLGDGEGLTEEPVLLVLPEYFPEVLTAVIRALVFHQSLRGFDVATLRWQSVTYPVIPKHLGRTYVIPGRQTAPTYKNWEIFRQSLRKTVRKNLTYYPRKLDKLGVNWRVDFVYGGAETKDAIDDLILLHRARSRSGKGPEHSNHIPFPKQEIFLQQTLGDLVERNEAFLVVLQIEGTTVAVQSMLYHDRGLMYYYSGFNPKWYDFSPLTILSSEIIAKAIKEKATEIEYLFTPAQWKQRWGAKQGSWVVSETHYNRSLLSLAKLAWSSLHRLYQQLRQITA